MINVLALPMYSRLGASSRLRIMQYVSWFDGSKISVTQAPFISDEMLVGKYRDGRYKLDSILGCYVNRIRHLMRRQKYDLLWIEKEALPWLPSWFELGLLDQVPYVLDYDDAVFHKYDLHVSPFIRFFFSKRINALMAKARLVVVGNPYLASRAHESGAQCIEVVPTVIDLSRYRTLKPCGNDNSALRIVWIGSPSTVKYLIEIAPALKMLAKKFKFTLCVIGATLELPGVDVECISWSEESEVDAILRCDIGIMPLRDSPWERGKCGYKLIQYMACGLPVVASPIGVNATIVRDGHNGFLASGENLWVDRLGKLLGDPALRTNLGNIGRIDVEGNYCVQQQGPRIATLLRNAAYDNL
jgi:glycosyltransferase involved in cell wall biosynthesis